MPHILHKPDTLRAAASSWVVAMKEQLGLPAISPARVSEAETLRSHEQQRWELKREWGSLRNWRHHMSS